MSADRVFADNPHCRLLGIGYPILQVGMYQVAWGPLAAAVSNAGGLGVIGSAFMPSSRLRQEIRIAKAETDRPFGVDILFAKVPAGGATITRSWQGRAAEIKPYPHRLKEVGGPASQRGRIDGAVINGVLPCGQSAGLIDEVERAGDVVTNIAARRRRFCRVWRSADIEEAARQG